jgi:DNA-binding response OmpR family regulator
MQVLIVESQTELAVLWQSHLERQGAVVQRAESEDDAVLQIGRAHFDVIVIDLMLPNGSALAVADYARFRHADTNVLMVTDNAFFSDGSIFSLVPNARALLQTSTPPEDLAAMVAHYGRAA